MAIVENLSAAVQGRWRVSLHSRALVRRRAAAALWPYPMGKEPMLPERQRGARQG
jgi:hypothetical protein